MYKEDLALNNLQWLMCHKTKPNQNPDYSVFIDLLNNLIDFSVFYHVNLSENLSEDFFLRRRNYSDDEGILNYFNPKYCLLRSLWK